MNLTLKCMAKITLMTKNELKALKLLQKWLCTSQKHTQNELLNFCYLYFMKIIFSHLTFELTFDLTLNNQDNTRNGFAKKK